jgi:hypothetical protein
VDQRMSIGCSSRCSRRVKLAAVWRSSSPPLRHLRPPLLHLRHLLIRYATESERATDRPTDRPTDRQTETEASKQA